jgi:hypothetical protein
LEFEQYFWPPVNGATLGQAFTGGGNTLLVALALAVLETLEALDAELGLGFGAVRLEARVALALGIGCTALAGVEALGAALARGLVATLAEFGALPEVEALVSASEGEPEAFGAPALLAAPVPPAPSAEIFPVLSFPGLPQAIRAVVSKYAVAA